MKNTSCCLSIALVFVVAMASCVASNAAFAHSLFGQGEKLKKKEESEKERLADTSRKIEQAMTKDGEMKKKSSSLEVLIGNEMAIIETYKSSVQDGQSTGPHDVVSESVARLSKYVGDYIVTCEEAGQCDRQMLQRARSMIRKYGPGSSHQEN